MGRRRIDAPKNLTPPVLRRSPRLLQNSARLEPSHQSMHPHHPFENLWDTNLLSELPSNYNFEAALAHLIDNSLQAVWHCSEGDRRLISVDVSGDRITVFDSGTGMDSNETDSIDKWGKIGASLHRPHKTLAIGGKPPYLKPYFGMFGCGGLYACMFLGRRTLVSSKTKESKKVFTLQFKKEALNDNQSAPGKNWKADGGMRDPSDEELKLSPHGSFTKVEIFDSTFDISKLYQLQCRLKDIYFPYIQFHKLPKTGTIERLVKFQVNGKDLAELTGGEVAITNLNSKGQDFSFQIKITLSGGKGKGTCQEANARLKFFYFPIVQGKESIENILERLEEEGCNISESFKTFGRVAIRRLGRLLPDVRWDSIPFMQSETIASTLQIYCQRVKCFIDLDAGFSPTSSKTDLVSQNPFTLALRNFGSKYIEKEKENDVEIVIHREGKPLDYSQIEQKYQSWVLEMYKTHDVCKCFKEKLDGYDERRAEVDKHIKWFEAERKLTAEKLSALQATLKPLGESYPEYLSSKASMMNLIEEKYHDTAASFFCCLYGKAPPPPSLFLSKKGVFGLVALLGSVASTSLSRVLSEYLGKDKMLALVSMSSKFGPKSSEYLWFQSQAARYNRSITDPLRVICLDSTRPWMNKVIENDPQRRLAMDNPHLPNGDPIPGFIGYAVNMIDLSPEELLMKTNSGFGLRETLFYGVFRELQVYKAEEDLEAALPYINDGNAVSLDGVIFKEGGFIYSRGCKPEIHFPITVPEEQQESMRKLEIARERKRKVEQNIVEGNRLLGTLEKRMKKATEKYQHFSATANS